LSWKKQDYERIPGTYLFDGKTSHGAFALNELLFSFNHEDNRQAFAQDAGAYADKYGVTDKQKKALLDEDFLGLLRLGANVYFLAKLAVPRGMSMQDAGAAFQGITTAEFTAKLASKGANLEQRLRKMGGYWHG